MSNYVSQCKDININTKYNIRGKYCKSYKYVPRPTIKYLKKKHKKSLPLRQHYN